MIRLDMVSSVGELLASSAAHYGDKTALVFEEQKWSFRQLDEATSRLASALTELGIGPGDKVTLYSPNSPEWVIGYYAVMKLGGVVNPLNLMLTPAEAAFAMQDCGAVAVIGSGKCIGGLADVECGDTLRHRISFGHETLPTGAIDFHGLIDSAAADFTIPAIDRSTPSTIGYTSGTTGHPKGAVLTHQAILMNTAMTATMHMRTAADTVVTALPCSHVYGNVVMNGAIAFGMTLVLHSSFDAESVLASVEANRATMLEGVPTMYFYILNHPARNRYDFSSLTRCTVGGQTMPESKMRDVDSLFGCPLIELWGMTELGGLGTTHSAYGSRRYGSIGVPLPHLEVRVSDAEDPANILPRGEVGELQIRGPVTMVEYLGRAEATADTLMSDGWLRTGDLVRQDEEGFIFVVDRLKDMINTSGFKIYPAELERVLAEHPSVAMVAVGSIPCDEKGELAKAYIVPRAEAVLDVAELDAFCRARLAAYKIPRAYQQVADLPRNSTGKILRRMLHTLGTAG